MGLRCLPSDPHNRTNAAKISRCLRPPDEPKLFTEITLLNLRGFTTSAFGVDRATITQD